MKVLVTGGAGFIGSHTAEALLKRGDHVVVVDEVNDYYDVRQKHHNLDILSETSQEFGSYYRFYEASCEDSVTMNAIFETEQFDMVCHLGARAGVRPSIKDPLLYIQANITATTVLLELSRKHNIKNFVYASSSSVYGKNAKIPFSESDMTDSPVSQYAATKKACELMAHTYHSLYKLPVTGLRFFTVYGPRGRPDMAPFKFVDLISRQQPIPVYGDGSSSRDYTYIDDIVSGVIASLDNPHPCEVYNLGNSYPITLNEFIGIIEESVGHSAIRNNLPDQPGDVPRTFADVSKAKRELGYSPKTSLREGMRKFVDWYRSYMETSHESMEPIRPAPVLAATISVSSSSTLVSDLADTPSRDYKSVHARLERLASPPSPPLSETGHR